MTTYVELKKTTTPVDYITLPVLYDAWGDPYVRMGFFETLFNHSFIGNYVLNEYGGTDCFSVKWKHVSGPPVRFPHDMHKRGWKPHDR